MMNSIQIAEIINDKVAKNDDDLVVYTMEELGDDEQIGAAIQTLSGEFTIDVTIRGGEYCVVTELGAPAPDNSASFLLLIGAVTEVKKRIKALRS